MSVRHEYQCAVCKGVFEAEWTDEEAQKEMKEIWGTGMTVDQCEQVCDDCFKLMGLG